MEIQKGTLVEILPTQIWIENGICGDRSVVLQHQGMGPFVYARFGYNYAYTSNAGTWDAAQQMARSLGATDPIEVRSGAFPKMSTPDELREQIANLTALLARIEPPAQPEQSLCGHCGRQVIGDAWPINPPAQPEPAPTSVSRSKRAELESHGYVVNGVALMHPETRQRVLLDYCGFVGWWHGQVHHDQQAQAERKPMTRDQVDDLAEDGVFLRSVHEIVQEVEAFHGIKGMK